MATAAGQRYDWFVGHVRAGTLDEAAAEEGFAPNFLAAVPPAQVVQVATALAEVIKGEVLSWKDGPDQIEVRYDGTVAHAVVEPEPPHRFIGLRFQPATQQLDDPRLADPPFSAHGEPGKALDALRAEYERHGAVGIVAAAFTDGGDDLLWAATIGYADLEAGRPMDVETPMLAGSISKLVTAVVVLQLVAGADIGLDDPVNRHLKTFRVADDRATIRHLLTHTAGISSEFDHYAAAVPPVADVLGPVAAVDFEPGARREYSNGGYAVLGEVITAVTGLTYSQVVQSWVFDPLLMTSSSMAMTWPGDVGPGYDADGGTAVPVERKVAVVPSSGGLCTTAADLGRFAAGWQTLLPEDVAQAAVTPQVDGDSAQGFGWVLGTIGGARVQGHAGAVLGFSSSLVCLPDSGHCGVVLANRNIGAEAVNLAVLTATLRA